MLTFEAKRDDSDGKLVMKGSWEGEGLDCTWIVMLDSCREPMKFASKGGTILDATHHLVMCGDSVLLYDMNVYDMIGSRAGAGACTVPFRSLWIPVQARKAIVRWARIQWELTPKDQWGQSCVKIEISDAVFARWERMYGSGKGAVELECKNEQTSTFLNTCQQSEQFQGMLDRVLTIARNSTSTFMQVAKVRLAKDWDGFTWEALTPKGGSIMWGGLVNHAARESGNDWSIHT